MFGFRSLITFNIRPILYGAFFRVYESSYSSSLEFSSNKIFGNSNRNLFSQRVISLLEHLPSSIVKPFAPFSLELIQFAGAVLVPLCTVSSEPALLLCLRPLNTRASQEELL